MAARNAMATKKIPKTTLKKVPVARMRQTVGESIVEGLKQAIKWAKGEKDQPRVPLGSYD